MIAVVAGVAPPAVVIVTMARRRVVDRPLVDVNAVAVIVGGDDDLARAIAEVSDASAERKDPRQRDERDGGGEPLGEERLHDL